MASGKQFYQVIGNLGKDPELKTIGNTTVCSFPFAITETYKVNNEKKETTTWLNCEAWGALADVLAKHCTKGSKMLFEGKLKNNDYEKDGVKHYGFKYVINNFFFMNTKNEQQSGGVAIPKLDESDVQVTESDEVPF